MSKGGENLSDYVTYAKAPLLELIVELRWMAPAIGMPPGAPQFISSKSPIFDKWNNRLSVSLEDMGYQHLERLLPHDFPPALHQPIFRFKRKSKIQFPLVQFGHGIFTINAGPPDYIDWKSFRPDVEAGISALLASRPVDSGINELTAVSIRYIDAFRENLREGASNYAFMKNNLQASINLPEYVLNLAANEDDILPTIALRFPLKDRANTLINLQVAAGKVNNEPATVMEMNSITHGKIATEVATVLDVLDESQKILHETFEAMTHQIQDRMQPQKRVE